MTCSDTISVRTPARGNRNRRLTVLYETATKTDCNVHAMTNEHLLDARRSFDTRGRRGHPFAKPPAQDHRSGVLDDIVQHHEQCQWALDGRTKHLQHRQSLVSTMLVLAHSDDNCFSFSNCGTWNRHSAIVSWCVQLDWTSS
jgi:hypothetical protein